MTTIESTVVSLTDPGLVVKMEDRKRLATQDPSDAPPPLKKQATAVNGGKAHPDADMPWRDDLERYQKDAIWRQMQEYKREKSTLESRVKDLNRKMVAHEEHITVLDAWLKQLLDEVKVMTFVTNEAYEGNSTFQTSLLFTGHKEFEKHLQNRADEIKSSISNLLSQVPKVAPEITQLQAQLAKKLADEKAINSAIERAIAEKLQLEERLEAASLRYMVAEKKIDRAKSLTVARLEKQYMLGPQRSADSSTRRDEGSAVNGATDTPERASEFQTLYNSTLAISNKQKEQLEKLEADNSKLLTQITELNIKLTKLSDEDYAHTDLFKQLKSQHEDVIKRINHLEATNVQLREEAEKLQAERTTYRIQIENEAQLAISEKESLLFKTESDLARIRNVRDELLADQQMRKAAQEQEKASICQMKELLEAREARIASLEQESGRLQLQIDGVEDVRLSTAELPHDELRVKFDTLEKSYEMLSAELSSMQIAFKKTSKVAAQKLAELTALDEKVQRLTAEKSKADQKYFAAMKSKETRDAELRSLRIQNMKSSDIISQLKDTESSTRILVSNVEKLLSETKEALMNVTMQYRSSQQQVFESSAVIQGLKSQATELKSLLAAKDTSLISATNSLRKAEGEAEELRSTLADTKKSLDSWKSRGLGNNTSEYEMLRTLALCTVCRRNFKNTAIKTCGHVFCKECVEERLTSRSRKCPNCNKSFGNNDHMHITM
ncbi:E3 ubiquitin-protein ligase bre1 [Myotisia sp. PD_48]|nr:E3 ubiquitin-protein ligase bre1 [Myotisia sp. PD_48]